MQFQEPHTVGARKAVPAAMIALVAGLAGCGSGPVFHPAPQTDTYAGLCSMLAIEQIEREMSPNTQDASVQFVVSYAFEPLDPARGQPSRFSMYFLTTRERAADVRAVLARNTEVACQERMLTQDPRPQILLGLPPIEGVDEVTPAPVLPDPPILPDPSDRPLPEGAPPPPPTTPHGEAP